MRRKVFSLMFVVVILTCAVGSYAQSPRVTEPGKDRAKIYKRCMAIHVSYDYEGEISKLEIASNCVDPKVSYFTALMPDEDIQAVFDEFFPPDQRGEEVSRINFSYGRAWGYTAYYPAVSLRRLNTCRQEVCGTISAVMTRETPKFPLRHLSP